jgi:hypothetical protein
LKEETEVGGNRLKILKKTKKLSQKKNGRCSPYRKGKLFLKNPKTENAIICPGYIQ